jgi:hypothetical protein
MGGFLIRRHIRLRPWIRLDLREGGFNLDLYNDNERETFWMVDHVVSLG